MVLGRATTTACVSTVACVLSVFALGGCGESSQAKAEASLCNGKTEVSAGVEDLAKQTAQTVSVASIEADIGKITGGLDKITSSQSGLTGARKSQAEQATSTLSGELDNLKQELKNLSPSEIKPRLTAAVEKLASGYKQALAPIKC
jgi:hypothetical protein